MGGSERDIFASFAIFVGGRPSRLDCVSLLEVADRGAYIDPSLPPLEPVRAQD